MKVHELRAKLDSADDGNLATSQLVMVLDVNSSMVYEVQDVVTETHDDGSETVWIKVEEF